MCNNQNVTKNHKQNVFVCAGCAHPCSGNHVPAALGSEHLSCALQVLSHHKGTQLPETPGLGFEPVVHYELHCPDHTKFMFSLKQNGLLIDNFKGFTITIPQYILHQFILDCIMLACLLLQNFGFELLTLVS